MRRIRPASYIVVGLLLITALACSVLEDEETPTATATPAGADIGLRITVAAVPADLPKYDRDDWRHWIDEDSDCQDARQEVLIAETTESVVFTDEDNCRVEDRQMARSVHGLDSVVSRRPRHRPYGAVGEHPRIGRMGMGLGRRRGRTRMIWGTRII